MKLKREFSRREKILLIVLVVLILAALYFYAVDLPARQANTGLKTETEDLQNEITILSAKKAKQDKMSAELDALLADPTTVAIPDYDNLQEVISFLNTVLYNTEDYSLSFPGIDFPKEGDSVSIARRYLSMTFVSPSYKSARTMIDRLQGSPYRCQIDGVTIRPVLYDMDHRLVEDAALTDGSVEVTLSMTFFENTK